MVGETSENCQQGQQLFLKGKVDGAGAPFPHFWRRFWLVRRVNSLALVHVGRRRRRNDSEVGQPGLSVATHPACATRTFHALLSPAHEASASLRDPRQCRQQLEMCDHDKTGEINTQNIVRSLPST